MKIMLRLTPRAAQALPVPGGRRRRGTLGRAAATVVAVVAAAGLVTACGGDDPAPRPIPAAQSFTPGVCQKLAPAVVDTMRITRADHGEPPAGLDRLADELIPPQERLYDQGAAAGPHAAEVERVTTAIGWLRLRIAGDNYEPALLAEVNAATEKLADGCTA
jgi:hypothetical protein